jgi:hypothetical protein
MILCSLFETYHSLEEHITFIFRFEKKAIKATPAYAAYSSTLKMEGVHSFKT